MKFLKKYLPIAIYLGGMGGAGTFMYNQPNRPMYPFDLILIVGGVLLTGIRLRSLYRERHSSKRVIEM